MDLNNKILLNEHTEFYLKYNLCEKETNNPFSAIQKSFGKIDFLQLNVVYVYLNNDIKKEYFELDQILLSLNEQKNLDRIEFYLENKNKSKNIANIKYMTIISDDKKTCQKSFTLNVENNFESICLGKLFIKNGLIFKQ